MKRICIAEDNLPCRELMRKILELQGYRVVEACDGREALKIIRETTPDLVLMDLQMPYADGFAVLAQLRQDPRFKGLPVMALTASAMKGDEERVLAAGFDGYATKPIDVSVLSERIKAILGEN